MPFTSRACVGAMTPGCLRAQSQRGLWRLHFQHLPNLRPSPALIHRSSGPSGRYSSVSFPRLPSIFSSEAAEKGPKTSRFSNLVELVQNPGVDDAASHGHQPWNASRASETEAFKNTPLFSSAAHDFVESRATSVEGGVDGADMMPQYGLLGVLQHEPIAGGTGDLTRKLTQLEADQTKYQTEKDTVDRLVLANMNVPWSAFICGSQGSGKSHTLSCMLENALVSGATDGASAAGKLPNPLAAIQFHYDNYANDSSLQLCEAAYMCSNPQTPVTVLVSPSNIWAMKRLYENLPGLPPGAPRPRVLPCYLSEDHLNIARILKLMASSPTPGAEQKQGPLYMEVVRSLIREMAMEQGSAGKFTYTSFRERLAAQHWVVGQEGPLAMRLQLLDSFMAPNTQWTQSTRPAASETDIWDFKPGSLTIVDLSDPFVSSDDACVMFSICLSLFMEKRGQCGRVVAMDEAHKVSDATSICLTGCLKVTS